MTYHQRKQERQDLNAYLLSQEWNVFGTLKFVNGRTIGRHSANKLLRSYWNKVDRTFFGKAAERQNMRVPRWCFAHEGSDHENYHIHFVMQCPLKDINMTCCVLNAVWSQHHLQTATLTKNWITAVRDRHEVASYLTREYWRLGAATYLDDMSWHDPTAVQRFEAYEHAKQAQRLSRAVSPLWLRHAQQAQDILTAKSEAHADQFERERG